MKNILILIVLCLCSLSLMGQISTESLWKEPKISVESQPTFEVRLDSTTRERYEDRMETLVKQKHIYTYNTDGNLVLTSAFVWHDEELFIDSENYHFYDSKGNMIEDYNCTKSSDGDIFFSTEYLYYDVEGNVSETVIYDEDEEEKSALKATYSYNSEGKEIKCFNYHWDQEDSVWKNSTKRETTRDENGKKTQSLSYRWYSYSTDWEKEGKRIYKSIEEDKSEVIHYNWIDKGVYDGYKVSQVAGWYERLKIIVTYDVQDRYVKQIRYAWDKKLQQWEPKSKVEWNYDESYDGSYKLLSPTPKSKNKLTSIVIHKWDKERSTWKLKSKATFYYSKRAVESESANQSPITVYPNPTEDFVMFDIENNYKLSHVKLYDIQGKTITSHQLSNDNQLSVSHLSSGTYIYQLHHNNQIYTGKIIVK